MESFSSQTNNIVDPANISDSNFILNQDNTVSNLETSEPEVSAAMFKKYILYIRKNDNASMKALSDIRDFQQHIWVQDIDQIPAEKRPHWLSVVPAFVSVETKTAFIGKDAFDEIARFHDSLKPKGKIQLSSAINNSSFTNMEDSAWHEASNSTIKGNVCGKPFATLNPTTSSLGARILSNNEKVNSNTLEQYIQLRNTTAPKSHLRANVQSAIAPRYAIGHEKGNPKNNSLVSNSITNNYSTHDTTGFKILPQSQSLQQKYIRNVQANPNIPYESNQFIAQQLMPQIAQGTVPIHNSNELYNPNYNHNIYNPLVGQRQYAILPQQTVQPPLPRFVYNAPQPTNTYYHQPQANMPPPMYLQPMSYQNDYPQQMETRSYWNFNNM